MARLQHFYGGDPERWVDIPVVMFEAYARELPSLQAQGSLRAATEVAIGSGVMKKETAESVMRSWSRVAQPRQRARKATDKDLASLPIKVTRVPVKPKE